MERINLDNSRDEDTSRSTSTPTPSVSDSPSEQTLQRINLGGTPTKSSFDIKSTLSKIGKGLEHEFSGALKSDYSPRDKLTLTRKTARIYRAAYNHNNNVFNATIDDRISIKKFEDYRPEPVGRLYFNSTNSGTPSGIAVIIPFFNETSHELQQTLNSLYISFRELQKRSRSWSNQKLYVCLIQDGWHKAHFTMQEYLKKLFPKKIGDQDWWDHFPEFKKDFNDDTSNAMYILETKNYEAININTQDELADTPCPLILTLLIKINNRRKHNSHEWFIGRNGFAEAINANYLFLTDAYTLYSDTCMFHLVKHLDRHPELGSVTGRQRLMTRDQQGCKDESIFSLAFAFRMMQLADFENANSVYNGAFHLGGLLPVIPGPCGLYRSCVLTNDRVRDAYLNLVNLEPHLTGLVVGNLKIAEDRVLSYESVVKMDHLYMGFNSLATFGFEAETDVQRFMLQRRRWINGSIAGYIYLLFINWRAFYEWKTSWIRKIYVWILLMCQLFTYIMVGISPGISLKILYYGVEYFANYYAWDIGLVLIGIFVIIWILYIAHVMIHNQNKFHFAIVYSLLALSVVTSVVTIASLFHYIFISTQADDSEFLIVYQVVLIMGVIVFAAPFFLAALLSGRGHSTMFMIKSFPHYIIFLPMLIAWFGSYAYSRTWDLSWGNRPANELSDVTKEKREIIVNKFKEQSVKIMLFLLLCNMIVFFLPLIAQVILVGTFFGIVIYQMFFSLIYCILRLYTKARVVMQNCWRCVKRKPDDRASIISPGEIV